MRAGGGGARLFAAVGAVGIGNGSGPFVQRVGLVGWWRGLGIVSSREDGPDGPEGVFWDGGRGGGGDGFEGGDVGGDAGIAEGDADVAEEALPAGAADGRSDEGGVELGA